MDFEQIKQNLIHALSRLLSLHVIISSAHEKIADLPAVYVLAAVLLAPWAMAGVVILGLLTRHSARIEQDAQRM